MELASYRDGHLNIICELNWYIYRQKPRYLTCWVTSTEAGHTGRRETYSIWQQSRAGLPFPHSVIKTMAYLREQCHRALLLAVVAVACTDAVPQCGVGCQRFVFDSAIATHGARCLDGSPPGFYVRPGKGKHASNFLVYSHGGSWCYGLNEADTSSTWNCAVRASTYEGSSK